MTKKNKTLAFINLKNIRLAITINNNNNNGYF